MRVLVQRTERDPALQRAHRVIRCTSIGFQVGYAVQDKFQVTQSGLTLLADPIVESGCVGYAKALEEFTTTACSRLPQFIEASRSNQRSRGSKHVDIEHNARGIDADHVLVDEK